jgi:hypothetical protein
MESTVLYRNNGVLNTAEQRPRTGLPNWELRCSILCILKGAIASKRQFDCWNMKSCVIGSFYLSDLDRRAL